MHPLNLTIAEYSGLPATNSKISQLDIWALQTHQKQRPSCTGSNIFSLFLVFPCQGSVFPGVNR